MLKLQKHSSDQFLSFVFYNFFYAFSVLTSKFFFLYVMCLFMSLIYFFPEWGGSAETSATIRPEKGGQSDGRAENGQA